MRITSRQYRIIKLVTVVVLATVFSVSIERNYFLIPIASLVVAWLVLLILRSRVDEVVADERDWQTGGKAALLAIQTYAWAAVIVMFVLFALRDTDPFFEPAATILAVSTCVLMLLYAFIFRYFHKVALSGRKTAFTVIAALAVALVVVAGLRILSGEDTWICDDGQWVKHGNPSRPMPDVTCIDGTPYFFHEGLSGLEIAYSEYWRDQTWVEVDKANDSRAIRFHYKASDGGRPLVLKLTIYPDDVGNDGEPWSGQDVVLRDERYVVTASRPAAGEYALGAEDLAVFERLAVTAEQVATSLRFRDGNVGQCASYSLDVCPAECVVCPPCPECSSISCQSAATCREMGIGRGWYEQVLERIVISDMYKADGQVIDWDTATRLIGQCMVEKVFQAHSKEVSLVLSTGRRLVTEEPAIDDVFDVVTAAEGECGKIIVGTE